MPTVLQLIRRRVEALANLDIGRLPPLDVLRMSERFLDFDTLRTNRVVIGAARYGLLLDPNKRGFNRVQSAIDRLQKYQIDRNAEHLVDAANLLELEYAEGDCKLIPIDDGPHVTEK